MIIRAAHNGKDAPYAIVSRKLLQENQIPYGPKCLLLLMLSYPDTWKFNVSHLADMMLQSEATIREWLKVLSELGYYQESATFEVAGSRVKVDWIVIEDPLEVKT